MKNYPLPQETMNEKRATHCAEVGFADLTAAAATQTLSPINILAKQGMEIVAIELAETFVSSDATLTSTSITIGDGGSATRFMSATELNEQGTEVFLKGGTLANTSLPYVYTSDDTVDVFVTGTAAKLLSSHTAGKLLIYYRLTDARPTAVS